jgi:hypothetical protein
VGVMRGLEEGEHDLCLMLGSERRIVTFFPP